MGNQSDATDDIQEIADSLPDTNEENPSDTAPSVIDIEGKAVRLDRGDSLVNRPVTGMFSTDPTFTKIEPDRENN